MRAIGIKALTLFGFLSATVVANLPNCRDLWSGPGVDLVTPGRIKEVREECHWQFHDDKSAENCFVKALENEDLANDFVRWVSEMINATTTDQWKVDIFRDYKVKCLSLLENKKVKEAEDCGIKNLQGRCAGVF